MAMTSSSDLMGMCLILSSTTFDAICTCCLDRPGIIHIGDFATDNPSPAIALLLYRARILDVGCTSQGHNTGAAGAGSQYGSGIFCRRIVRRVDSIVPVRGTGTLNCSRVVQQDVNSGVTFQRIVSRF